MPRPTKRPNPEDAAPAAVKTVEEFRRVYLPSASAAPKLDTLSAQQLGELLAAQSLETIRGRLNRK